MKMDAAPLSQKRRVPSLSSPLLLDETTLLTERRRSGPASVELRYVQDRKISYEGTLSREKEEMGIRGGWEFGGKDEGDEERKGELVANQQRFVQFSVSKAPALR